jgi:DNA-binding transcriptional LysR family regulator
MRVDLRSLELLLAVADGGSIGAAAKAAGMTQPAATERLRRLEQQLRLQLLDRSPRGTRLTMDGTTVAGWARGVMLASDRLETGVTALRQHSRGRLRISASMTVAEYLVPGWLSALGTHTPRTEVALRVRNSYDVARDVLDGRADLGFVEGTSIPHGLSGRVIGVDELVPVVSAGHPWTRRRKPIGVSELARAPLILREPGSGTREALEQALGRLGHSVVPHLELGSTAAIKAAVAAGQGVSVLSRLAVAGELASGQLRAVRLDGIDLHRRLRAVWRAGVRPSGLGAELLAQAIRSRLLAAEP